MEFINCLLIFTVGAIFTLTITGETDLMLPPQALVCSFQVLVACLCPFDSQGGIMGG